MKISLLGTNGFLSTAIAKYANEKQWQLDVFGLDEPIGHTFDAFHKVNMMDNNFDCSLLIDSDIIVYAVGAGIQSNLKESSSIIYTLNVTIPVNICNKLKELNYTGRFVTFGSVFEMGETKEQHPFTEEELLSTTAPAPTDYIVSKRMLTRFATSYKHNFTHWHFIIPTIYGTGENPKRLIPYTIDAIKNNETLHFTAGNQVRQYVNVCEVPRLLDLATINDLPSGIYNIEGNDTLSVHELVLIIHEIMNKKVPDNCFGTAERSDVGMKYLALDGGKLRRAIGFKTQISIADGIKSY